MPCWNSVIDFAALTSALSTPSVDAPTSPATLWNTLSVCVVSPVLSAILLMPTAESKASFPIFAIPSAAPAAAIPENARDER